MTPATYGGAGVHTISYIVDWHGPKVKKGRGQRKNKRDRDGRRLHLAICRLLQQYSGTYTVTLAS